MKTEDFDEAIRKKLESVNQTFTESEIDKVYHHVVSKRRFPWKGSNASWLLYSVAAAALTVTTFLAVSHFRSEKKEILRNDSISRMINETKTDSIKVTDDTTVSKHSIKAEPKVSQDQHLQQVVDAVPVQDVNKSVPYNKVNVQRAQGNQTQNTQPIKPTEKVRKTITEPEVAVTKNDQQAVSKSEPLFNKVLPVDTVVVNNPIIITQDLPVSNAVVVSPLTEAMPKSNDTKTEVPKETRQNKPDALPTAKSQKAVAQPDQAELISGKPEQPDVSGTKTGKLFKNAEIRTGADFKLSNHLSGMGVTGELLLKNHLSFQTGLNYCILNAEQYSDTGDVFRHKHHDFNHRIEDHLHDKHHLSEIAIDNRLIQIPIAFRYYVPLKRNYSVSFSLGTDLDIFINQKISYNHEADSGRIDNGSFTAKGDVTSLNNLVISAGLEKRWKSLVFQLQPFISPQLKQVFYKPKEMEFGVGVGIKYGFGK